MRLTNAEGGTSIVSKRLYYEMPLYEYVCRECKTRFELLRPASRMDETASCPRGHAAGERVLSIFAAMSRDGAGNATAVGGGACAGCSAGSCAGCSVN